MTRSRILTLGAALACVAAVLVTAGGAGAQDGDPLGTAWQRVSVPDEGFAGPGDQTVVDVAAGGPGFVAIGNDSAGPLVQPAVWTSPDGGTWDRVALGAEMADPAVAVRLAGIASNGDALVAVGAQGIECAETFTLAVFGACERSVPVVFWSADGSTWNRGTGDVFHAGGDSVATQVVAADDGFYTVVNWRQTTEWHVEILWSATGETWQVAHTADSEWPLTAIAAEWADDRLVVLMTEALDLVVRPLMATQRGGGYVISSDDDDGSRPSVVRAAVGTAADGFRDEQILEQRQIANTPAMWTFDGATYARGSGAPEATVLRSVDLTDWEPIALDWFPGAESFRKLFILPNGDGLTAVMFLVEDDALTTPSWVTTDGLTWEPSGVDAPPLDRVESGAVVDQSAAGIEAVAVADGVAVAVGADATRGDSNAAFWTTAGAGGDGGSDGGDPGTGSGATTADGCELVAEAMCAYADAAEADLAGVVAPGADLTASDLTGADLAGADLSAAVLVAADLRGADLTGADLSGADLTNADLTDATLDGATLTGAVFRLADLAGASLIGASLPATDLDGALMPGADLSGASAATADLSAVDLRGAVFVGAELTGSEFRGAFASGADFGEAAVSDAGFSDADLSGARFDGVIGRQAGFVLADLRGASFAGAELTGAVFQLADLTGADLTGATGQTTSFIEAVLRGATLTSDGFGGSYWGTTICPDGFVTGAYPSASCAGHEAVN